MKFIRLLLTGILFMIALNIHAQYDKVWIFGRGSGLDFNSDPPVPVRSAIMSGEGCASVCDAEGRLLFYTEGSYVWNRNNDTMPNGRDLTGLWPAGRSATESSVQGTVIVPIPGNSHKYYIFSLSAWTSGPPPGTEGKLYYSIVDMNLNNGMGDVEPADKGRYLSATFTEEMTAVAGDHCNVWLIMHANDGHIRAYEINENGINPTPVESVFPNPTVAGQSIKIAPNRKKIVAVDVTLRLGDFNPATGQVSNVITIPDYVSLAYSAEFSPDNTKLYTYDFRADAIVQFDISSNDPATILNSKTIITPAGKNGNLYFKLGPDNKIYFQGQRYNTGNNNISLSRINLPNAAGTACQYQLNAISLLDGTSVNLGLPNVVPVIDRDTLLTRQSISAPPFATGYLVEVIDATGWGYTWNDGTTGTQKTVSSGGKYWVVYYTAPCVYHTDTFLVSFPCTLPEVETEASCRNEYTGKAWVHRNPGDTVSYRYTWRDSMRHVRSVSDTLQYVPPGRYTLQIETEQCDTTLTIVIPEADLRVSFTVDSIVCEGEEVAFKNNSENYFSRFVWYFGDGDSSSLTEPVHIYKHPGSYEVMLSGAGEVCKDTVSEIIVADPRLSVYFTKNRDSVCLGEPVTFSHKMDSETIKHLSWQMGDSNAFFSMDKRWAHAYDRPGAAYVRLLGIFRACPEDAFSDTVFVANLPEVDLGRDTSLCLNGTMLTLENRYSSLRSQRYLWSTGDTSETLQVVHPGTYSLKVTDMQLGCSHTEVVVVKKDCYLDVPNVFTPNGDGTNDYFFPKPLLAKGIVRFSMKIFNRQGQLLFETFRPDGRGWDGRYKGVDQPGGVYVYRIEVELRGRHVSEAYTGNVTLIR